jgi:hypothetical protein
MNEGHSAFLVLERLREGLDLEAVPRLDDLHDALRLFQPETRSSKRVSCAGTSSRTS